NIEAWLKFPKELEGLKCYYLEEILDDQNEISSDNNSLAKFSKA
ncbi:40665_t:CDS:1, partial [Gigaspora margarita]